MKAGIIGGTGKMGQIFARSLSGPVTKYSSRADQQHSRMKNLQIPATS